MNNDKPKKTNRALIAFITTFIITSAIVAFISFLWFLMEIITEHFGIIEAVAFSIALLFCVLFYVVWTELSKKED